MMMEEACTSETSVGIQLRTRQYIPEYSELHDSFCYGDGLLHCQPLTWRITHFVMSATTSSTYSQPSTISGGNEAAQKIPVSSIRTVLLHKHHRSPWHYCAVFYERIISKDIRPPRSPYLTSPHI
jgi:hypothetical protein